MGSLLSPQSSTGGLVNGDKGDITVAGGGASLTVDPGAITTTKLGGDITAAGKALLDDADATAQRATLSLGTAATQSSSAFEAAGSVAAHAAVTSGVHGISAFGASLVDDADASAARTTLGLGTAAVANASDFEGAWTYVKLGADFTTSLAADTAVTGLAFTPAANQVYAIRGQFLLRTANTTTGARPGCSWPATMSDGVAEIRATNNATTDQLREATSSGGAASADANGLPSTTQSWPGSILATLVAGPTPSGSFQITLRSETGGTNVTMKAGSWIRYKAI